MATDYLVVMVTVADAEAGVALGKALVAEGLAGCVQVIPGGTAIYRWQGQLRTDYQVQLFIKTPRAAWEALQARILELHGDEVPEILALPVLDGLPSYLQWLDESEQGEETAVGWQDYGLLYPGDEHTVSGTLKVLRGVESPQLGNRRDLVVYLPPSYGEGDRRYPVIYMHDGQNLFDAATSNAGEWQVDETLETLSTEGIEAIVVGVPNMGEKRAYEYVSFPSSWLAEVGGDLYTAFLAETVKPLIDRDFRTLPEREATGVMGSSLGGLISLYAIFRRPDVFGMAGVVSLAIGQVSRRHYPLREEVAVSGRHDLPRRGDGRKAERGERSPGTGLRQAVCHRGAADA